MIEVTSGSAVWQTAVASDDTDADRERLAGVVEQVIPQAALSAPELREAKSPVLCEKCKEPVCMIDREVSGAVHPFCARKRTPAEQ